MLSATQKNRKECVNGEEMKRPDKQPQMNTEATIKYEVNVQRRKEAWHRRVDNNKTEEERKEGARSLAGVCAFISVDTCARRV
jgi:rubrerythrin